MLILVCATKMGNQEWILFRFKRWIIVSLSLVPALFFQNCQNSDTKITSYKPQIASEASSYLNEFIVSGAERNVSFSINNLSILILTEQNFKKFLKIKESLALEIIGYCYFEPEFSADGQMIGENPIVLVNESKWLVMKEYQKKELIFHELGHCVLHKKHSKKIIYTDNASITNTQDLSIMNPIMLSLVLSEEEYLSYMDILADDLFNRDPSSDIKNTEFKVQKGKRFGYSEDTGCEEF